MAETVKNLSDIDIDDLISRSKAIRYAVVSKSITAEMVGSLFYDMICALKILRDLHLDGSGSDGAYVVFALKVDQDGATVTVNGENLAGDEDGVYAVMVKSGSTVEWSVSCEGYETQSESEEVTENITKEITLVKESDGDDNENGDDGDEVDEPYLAVNNLSLTSADTYATSFTYGNKLIDTNADNITLDILDDVTDESSFVGVWLLLNKTTASRVSDFVYRVYENTKAERTVRIKVTATWSDGTKMTDYITITQAAAQYTLIIEPTPEDAVVEINGEKRTEITVDYGTEVSYEVSADGYNTESGSHTVTENYTKNVNLEVEEEKEWTAAELISLANEAAAEGVDYYMLTSADDKDSTVYIDGEAMTVPAGQSACGKCKSFSFSDENGDYSNDKIIYAALVGDIEPNTTMADTHLTLVRVISDSWPEECAPTALFNLSKNYTTKVIRLIGKAKSDTCKGLFKEIYGELETIDFSGFDFSEAMDFSRMFEYTAIPTLILPESFNTSKATNLNGMFSCCYLLYSENFADFLSKFDVSHVTDFGYVFEDMTNVKNIRGFENWDVSSGICFRATFYNCCALTSLDLSGWDVSSGTDFRDMFGACCAMTSLDINGWNFSKCDAGLGMNGMFWSCSELTTVKGTFSGIKTDISLSDCPLDRDSALRFISALETVIDSRTITFSDTTAALLTYDDVSDAKAKGWTVLPEIKETNYLHLTDIELPATGGCDFDFSQFIDTDAVRLGFEYNSDDEWLIGSCSSDDATLFDYDDNFTGAARTGSITVTANYSDGSTKTGTITVTQKSFEIVTLSVKPVPADAKVTINGEAVGADADGLCTTNVVKGSNVTWKVEYEGYISQEGTIEAIYEDTTREIEMVKRILTLAADTLPFDSDGNPTDRDLNINEFYNGYRSLVADTNADNWSIEVTDGEDWIYAGSVLNGLVNVRSSNDLDEMRTGYVIVTAKWSDGETLTNIMTVTQEAGTNYFKVTDFELDPTISSTVEVDIRDYIDSNAEEFSIVGISSNAEPDWYEFDEWYDWRFKAYTSGTGDESRWVRIVIRAVYPDGSTAERTLKVTQDAYYIPQDFDTEP